MKVDSTYLAIDLQHTAYMSLARAGLKLVTFRSQSRRFPSTPHMSTCINFEICSATYVMIM